MYHLVISALMAVAVDNGRPPDLLEMMADARASNDAATKAGVLQFRVKHEIVGRRPLLIEGAFTWDGEDGLWTYKFSDPDFLESARQSFQPPIDQAQTEHMLRKGKKIYVYSARNNILHVYPVSDGDAVFSSYRLFDLFPASLWGRCCPPNHGSGRPWREMFGQGSPAAPDGATADLESTGDQTYRYTRRDPDGGVSRTDMSLRLSGQITSFQYVAKSAKSRSRAIEYTWEKLAQGPVVLRRCVSKTSKPGEPSHFEWIHTVDVDRIALRKTSGGARFGFDEFQKLLPKDTKVVDNISNRSYPLHPSTAPADDRLKELSRELRELNSPKTGEQP